MLNYQQHMNFKKGKKSFNQAWNVNIERMMLPFKIKFIHINFNNQFKVTYTLVLQNSIKNERIF